MAFGSRLRQRTEGNWCYSGSADHEIGRRTRPAIQPSPHTQHEPAEVYGRRARRHGTEGESMKHPKHLLISVTAVMAIAATGPVWAQAYPPGTPQAGPPAAYPGFSQ